MPGVPGGLDEDPPDVGVARFRDAPTPFLIPGGGLAREEPDIGHESPGVAEALEVPNLDQDRQRPEGIDPPEAAEPGHRGPVRRLLGNGLDLPLQVGAAGEELTYGEAVLLRCRGSLGMERSSGTSAPGRSSPATSELLLSSRATYVVSFFTTGLLSHVALSRCWNNPRYYAIGQAGPSISSKGRLTRVHLGAPGSSPLLGKQVRI